MSVKLHILNASGRLKKFETLIKDSFTTSLKTVENKIKLPDVDVIIDDDQQAAIPETGVGGSAPTPHLLYIHIDPEFPDIEKCLDLEIRSTVAHELHHCARWAARGYGTTLLEAVVSEGLADHFDIEVNGSAPKPWSVAVMGSQLESVRQKAQKEFLDQTYNHPKWFFGTGDVPRWAGYSLGYAIVGEYLKKSGKKASELVDADAKLFVEV